MSNLLAFIKAHKASSLVFAMALGAFLWFAGNFVLTTIYWWDPRHQDQALEHWMTPRYVAMSYDLPRKVVEDVLDLPADGSAKRHRLGNIAANMGVSLEELTELVRSTAAEHRASNQ